MERVQSIAPIIDENSRVLILGTVPGPVSLATEQYYASPRNSFWKMIYRIFDAKLDPTYDQRVAFLKSKRIALWDIIHSCTREGGSDKKIRDPKFNDIGECLRKYRGIRCIYFNGEEAERQFKKSNKEKFTLPTDRNIVCYRLPSTSSANTRMGTARKQHEWENILKCLD